MQLTLRALKMGPDHRDKVVTVAPEFWQCFRDVFDYVRLQL